MSAAPNEPFQDARRRDVLGLRPDLAARHEHLLDVLWEAVDPVLLELCRLRMATLMGAAAAVAERSPAAVDAGLTEDLVRRLPAWPSDPAFDGPARAALAFTEQHVVDHHGITDDHVRDLTEALGADGVVALTTALGVWDAQHRLDLALGVVAP